MPGHRQNGNFNLKQNDLQFNEGDQQQPGDQDCWKSSTGKPQGLGQPRGYPTAPAMSSNLP